MIHHTRDKISNTPCTLQRTQHTTIVCYIHHHDSTTPCSYHPTAVHLASSTSPSSRRTLLPSRTLPCSGVRRESNVCVDWGGSLVRNVMNHTGHGAIGTYSSTAVMLCLCLAEYRLLPRVCACCLPALVFLCVGQFSNLVVHDEPMVALFLCSVLGCGCCSRCDYITYSSVCGTFKMLYCGLGSPRCLPVLIYSFLAAHGCPLTLWRVLVGSIDC